MFCQVFVVFFDGSYYLQIQMEVEMAVKILIKRHFKENAAEQAGELLNNFRRDAMRQPGYISGETWHNHYDPRSITVVSTWQSVDDWIRWEESEARAANEEKLERLLEESTKFEVYDLGGMPGK
jgi:heme oxygenase (mycobilin-producing)